MDYLRDLRAPYRNDSKVEIARQILELWHGVHRPTRVEKVRGKRSDPRVALDEELGAHGPSLDSEAAVIFIFQVQVLLVSGSTDDCAPERLIKVAKLCHFLHLFIYYLRLINQSSSLN